MPTKAQIAANRANAQRSSGPRTDDGKAKARQNALRHGLCATIPTMSHEVQEEIQTLLDILREEHEPVGATEEILLYKMAEHFIFGKRASTLLTSHLNWAGTGPETGPRFSLLLRYHSASDRGYHKAFSELRKLQNERKLQEIGFVSENPKGIPEPAPEAPPSEPLNPEPAPSKPLETTQPDVQPIKKVASPFADALPELLRMAAGDPELTDIVLQFAKEAA